MTKVVGDVSSDTSNNPYQTMLTILYNVSENMSRRKRLMKVLPFPDKKYQIIYADPPWDFGGSKRMPVRKKDRKYPSSGHEFYPIMTVDEICALPIQEICEKNCLLFLWVPSSLIENALKVGSSWGFRFSTVGFVWDKQIPNPGAYTLIQTEQCFVFKCKYGKIPEPRGKRNIKQFLSSQRGRHSEKPAEIRNRITEMFPTQSKIELFARERFVGWDAWGNEVDNR